MKYRYWIRLSIISLCTILSACTNVKPWQKGSLSKPEMAWTNDSLESSIEQHIFSSKEASHGGDGAAGGGCGCN